MPQSSLTRIAIVFIFGMVLGFGISRFFPSPKPTPVVDNIAPFAGTAAERTEVVPVPNKDSETQTDIRRCREILEILAGLSFDPQNLTGTVSSLRNVRTQVEILAAMNPWIAPVLLEFLESGRDVHYPVYLFAQGRLVPQVQKDSVEDKGDWLGRREFKPTTDLLAFAFPPSVRIAVLEVLFRFRNPEVLARILQMSQSFKLGAELAFCDRMWNESGGDSNQRVAFQKRASQLIHEPSTNVPDNDLLLAWQSQYLLGLLNSTGGSGLQQVLASNLIKMDGSLDLNILDQSVHQLGASVVPLLRRTFEDPRLKDGRHRAYVAGLATDYFGIDDAANEFLKSAIKDDSLPEIMKLMLIQSLGGYNMFKQKYVPVTPETFAVRVNLMKEFQTQSKEFTPVIQGAIERYISMMKYEHKLQ